jgi:membrane associated rhomboid family serine protease
VFLIRDDNPQILNPYATYGIIAVNVLVWVFVQGLGSNPLLVMLFRKPEVLHRHPYCGWKKRSPTANWHRIDRDERNESSVLVSQLTACRLP